VAGSLALGTVSAAALLRALQVGGRPATLARALGERGRIAKTRYLLADIDDEAYRRRILVQRNRGERRHSLARATFHGQKGELRQRYREGQEDQLGALGLVVNVLVRWNTRSLGVALEQLRAAGAAVNPEDVARRSPLGYDHSNLLGRDTFALAEPLARGALRPLCDPTVPDAVAQETTAVRALAYVAVPLLLMGLLQALSVPAGDHRPRRVVVRPLRAQLSRCRGAARRAGHAPDV